MSFLSHCTVQKQNGKKDAVRPVGPNIFKVIFILLTKAVAVQMKISIVKVGKAGLQKLFSKLYLDESKKLSLILVF